MLLKFWNLNTTPYNNSKIKSKSNRKEEPLKRYLIKRLSRELNKKSSRESWLKKDYCSKDSLN
jgi:hypothetical protein